MISHYCHLAVVTGREVGQVSGAGAAARLGADTGNVRRMILAAVQRRNVDLTVDAVPGMLEYARFIGVDVAGIVEPALAMVAAAHEPRSHAWLLTAAGDIALGPVRSRAGPQPLRHRAAALPPGRRCAR